MGDRAVMEDRVAALEDALASTTAMVQGIGADQWERPTPCAAWNVRQLVQHTVGVMANFASAAANAGPVGDPAEFDLGDDPAGVCASTAADCVKNWSERGELESEVSLGESGFPGEVALGINTLDAYVHGWDIAVATGQDLELDAGLCSDLLVFAKEIVPPTPREGDAFAGVVPVEADADVQDQLLGYLGRTP